jgi:hypothetical protein
MKETNEKNSALVGFSTIVHAAQDDTHQRPDYRRTDFD